VTELFFDIQSVIRNASTNFKSEFFTRKRRKEIDIDMCPEMSVFEFN
jgi:hypothetical protein